MMKKKIKKFKKGQVMVESAIGLPVFLLLTLGAIETARIALKRIQITYASFQANRVATVNRGEYEAISSAINYISNDLEDAQIQFENWGTFYTLQVTDTLTTMLPWIRKKYVLSGFSILPSGNFQNKEFAYKYKGYSSYYPALWDESDMEDPDKAGILTYDRNIRAFIRCEDNPYEEWAPGRRKYGGGGEAEIVKGGKDESGDPFHLGSWYPPYGILRNPGPEKSRTGNQARIDQYYFVEAMLRGPSMLPFSWFLPENKPYWSRAITGFGHGNNLHTGQDAFPYRGDVIEWARTRFLSTRGWFGFWPYFESFLPPLGCDGRIVSFYYVGAPWGGGSWNPYYKDSDNFMSGFGIALADACWTIPNPWGCDPSFGARNGNTWFYGWHRNYIGDRYSNRSPYNWADWKGNRRLYDAAFYVATWNELEYIYLFEGFIEDHPNHGKSSPMKDDLRGFGVEWKCMTPQTPWDRWNGKEKK